MKLLFALCCLLAAAPRPAHSVTLRALTEASPAPVSRVYKHVYKRVEGAQLKLYTFQPERAKPGERLPAFVWIHGGGWTSGDAQSGFPHARYFASRGMVGFSIEYRLAKSGGPFIGDALADCKSAIRYIRTHASELGVDPKRIAVAGDSAGAHLAAALGSLADAMLLYNGIFDLTAYGPTREDTKARALSPMFHVHRGQPPAIVLHGLDDTVVSPDQSRRFAALMKQAGNRCDLVLVEHANHAFVLPEYTAPERVVVKAIRDGDAFLSSLGFISGTPTLETLAPLPQPRTGWWTERHKQILARVKQGDIDLVWIGDSITQNFEKANPPDENFQPRECTRNPTWS